MCRCRYLLFVLTALLTSPLLSAQEQMSLADAAKQARSGEKPKSKIVVTDDTLPTPKGPFPDIALEGPSNSEQILNAIRGYRSSHTPQETEKAVREWFDYFDDRMVQAFKEDEAIRARNYERHHSILVFSSIYSEREQQVISDAYGNVQDQRATQQNTKIISRSRTVLQEVRNGLVSQGLRYTWMKIHNNATETF